MSSTEIKFYQSLSYLTVTDERVLLNCHKHYTLYSILMMPSSSSSSSSSFFLFACHSFLSPCLPAWLQKHRASIDSSQIMMTSIHYSSSHSHFLSVSSYIAAIWWCFRQIGGNSGEKEGSKRKKKKKINVRVHIWWDWCVWNWK